MSFGLARDRDLDPTGVAVTPAELPPLPDGALTDPSLGRVDIGSWFPNPAHLPRPLEIEIGSGKGTFLVQQGAEQPGTNFLGIEWAREFFEYTADRVRRRGLTNVRMLNLDAGEFFRWRVGDGVAGVIHLYFPDPWPKKRHHKRRIVQDPFLAECRRILIPGGELRIVTDHPDYWAWMCEHVERATSPTGPGGSTPALFIKGDFERVGSAQEGELVGSNFERKYRREGRPFHSVILRKPSPTIMG